MISLHSDKTIFFAVFSRKIYDEKIVGAILAVALKSSGIPVEKPRMRVDFSDKERSMFEHTGGMRVLRSREIYPNERYLAFRRGALSWFVLWASKE